MPNHPVWGDSATNVNMRGDLANSADLADEGTYASVKSLLSRDYMHHVDLSETRKSPKG